MDHVFFSAFFNELEKLATTTPIATPGPSPTRTMKPMIRPPSSTAMSTPQTGTSNFPGQPSPLQGSISGLPTTGTT